MHFLLSHLHQHPFHYLFLSIGLFIALIFVFIFRYEPFFQQYVVYSTAVFYLLWGIIHHYHRGDLHLTVILEYLIIALLAVLVATGLSF